MAETKRTRSTIPAPAPCAASAVIDRPEGKGLAGGSPRGGFTLLEVVLALGLSLLLLGAVLTAMEIYRRVSTSGREEAERSQLIRAVLRMIETDIRSCTFQKARSSSGGTSTSAASGPGGSGGGTGSGTSTGGGTGTTGGGDADTGTSATGATATTLDAATAFAGDSQGIIGDANSVVIHASRPTDRLSAILLGEGSELGSDAKSIAYFLAVPGGAGLQGIAGNLLSVADDRSVQGLARLEGDRLAIQFADANGDTAALAASSRLLAPEVDGLRFRYFDGASWYDAWDSAAYQRLPLAVEVTLSFRRQKPPGTPSAPRGAASADAESVVYRHVIAVPAAEPAALAAAADATAQ